MKPTPVKDMDECGFYKKEMKLEPLKNKGIAGHGRYYNHFTKEDVVSAVLWLKEELNDRIIRQTGYTWITELIDQAFADVSCTCTPEIKGTFANCPIHSMTHFPEYVDGGDFDEEEK